jgi:tRNA(fMet)-specific endonuclease VapC
VEVSRILLDTSGYSGLANGHSEIVHKVQSAAQIHLNPIVLGELRAGYLAGSKRIQNEAALQSFLDSYRVGILTIDEETSLFYAAIHQSLRQAGTPISTNDLWIASCAMQHGLPLVTMDSDFLKVQQIIVQCYH